MHTLLERQLRRLGIDTDAAADGFRQLIATVDQTYVQVDDDREMLERSLDLSSQELLAASANLRALFEALPDLVVRLQDDGSILEVKGAFAGTGPLKEVRPGSSIQESLPEAATVLTAGISEVRQNDTLSTLELDFTTDGLINTYEARLLPLSSAQLLLILRDISDRKRAVDALRESEERFRSLAQNSSDMILIVSREGRPIYVSPSVTRIMGYEAEELTNLNVLTVIHPDQLQEAANSLRAVIEEPGIHPPKELLLRHRDGSFRSIEMTAYNLLDDPAIGGIVYNARDVTDRRQAEDSLKESEERFRQLAENSPVGIYQLGSSLEPLYLNPALRKMLEIEATDELRTIRFEELFSPESLSTVREHHELREQGKVSTYEVQLVGRKGTRRSVLISGGLVNDSSGRPNSSLGTVTDITERKQAEEAMRQSEQRFRSLVQNAGDLITVVDAEDIVRYQSPSVQGLLGIPAQDVVGRKITEAFVAEHEESFRTFLARAVHKSARSATVELRLRHRDGSWRYVQIIGTDLHHDAAVGGVVLNTRDITESKALEEQLRHQAFHDALTGLANRARFTDRLDHALKRARRAGGSAFVMFIDLDNFKAVNDSLGHSIGDLALVEAGRRVEACLRPGDTLARFGGDEFVVLLEDADREQASTLADQVIGALKAPMEVAGSAIFMRASIGIAECSDGDAREASTDDLVRNADIAMYVAKGRGRGRYEFYESSMYDSAVERMELTNDLQNAVRLGQLVVHYQPTVSLKSGQITGFEALVRWTHPGRGLLYPDRFISLAEESGAIIDLGLWVLREACRQTSLWQRNYPSSPPLIISVNVSPKQLQDGGFVEGVRSVLAETRLAPGSLVLEVTETAMMQDAQTTVEILADLKRQGVRIAIDDFGTGFSSLAQLRDFPFDIIKVDRSFIATVAEPGGDRELTRTIIDLSKSLHVITIAEGIEGVEQLERLQALDCDLGQGFYFSEAVPPAEVDELLRGDRALDEAA